MVLLVNCFCLMITGALESIGRCVSPTSVLPLVLLHDSCSVDAGWLLIQLLWRCFYSSYISAASSWSPLLLPLLLPRLSAPAGAASTRLLRVLRCEFNCCHILPAASSAAVFLALSPLLLPVCWIYCGSRSPSAFAQVLLWYCRSWRCSCMGRCS